MSITTQVQRDPNGKGGLRIGLAAGSPAGSLVVTKVKEFVRMKEGDVGANRALDLALIRLAEDPPESAKRALLAHAARIDGAEKLEAVGFGLTEADQLGLKHHVDVVIASTACAGSVRAGKVVVQDSAWYGCAVTHELVAGRLAPFAREKAGPAPDTCNGDSGGPLFLAQPNSATSEMRTIAAITSRAVSRLGLNDGATECGDGGVYVRVDGLGRKWIDFVLEKVWKVGPLLE
jgi:secreted trypsin-like serine protease